MIYSNQAFVGDLFYWMAEKIPHSYGFCRNALHIYPHLRAAHTHTHTRPPRPTSPWMVILINMQLSPLSIAIPPAWYGFIDRFSFCHHPRQCHAHALSTCHCVSVWDVSCLSWLVFSPLALYQLDHTYSCRLSASVDLLQSFAMPATFIWRFIVAAGVTMILSPYMAHIPAKDGGSSGSI